jgi:hypothetical protein
MIKAVLKFLLEVIKFLFLFFVLFYWLWYLWKIIRFIYRIIEFFFIIIVIRTIGSFDIKLKMQISYLMKETFLYKLYIIYIKEREVKRKELMRFDFIKRRVKKFIFNKVLMFLWRILSYVLVYLVFFCYFIYGCFLWFKLIVLQGIWEARLYIFRKRKELEKRKKRKLSIKERSKNYFYEKSLNSMKIIYLYLEYKYKILKKFKLYEEDIKKFDYNSYEEFLDLMNGEMEKFKIKKVEISRTELSEDFTLFFRYFDLNSNIFERTDEVHLNLNNRKNSEFLSLFYLFFGIKRKSRDILEKKLVKDSNKKSTPFINNYSLFDYRKQKNWGVNLLYINFIFLKLMTIYNRINLKILRMILTHSYGRILVYEQLVALFVYLMTQDILESGLSLFQKRFVERIEGLKKVISDIAEESTWIKGANILYNKDFEIRLLDVDNIKIDSDLLEESGLGLGELEILMLRERRKIRLRWYEYLISREFYVINIYLKILWRVNSGFIKLKSNFISWLNYLDQYFFGGLFLILGKNKTIRYFNLYLYIFMNNRSKVIWRYTMWPLLQNYVELEGKTYTEEDVRNAKSREVFENNSMIYKFATLIKYYKSVNVDYVCVFKRWINMYFYEKYSLIALKMKSFDYYNRWDSIYFAGYLFDYNRFLSDRRSEGIWSLFILNDSGYFKKKDILFKYEIEGFMQYSYFEYGVDNDLFELLEEDIVSTNMLLLRVFVRKMIEMGYYVGLNFERFHDLLSVLEPLSFIKRRKIMKKWTVLYLYYIKRKLKKWHLNKDRGVYLNLIHKFLFYWKLSFKSKFFFEKKKLLLKEINKIKIYELMKEEITNFTFFINSEEFHKQRANFIYKMVILGLKKGVKEFTIWMKREVWVELYFYLKLSYKYIISFVFPINNIFIWKFDKLHDLSLIARVVFYFREKKSVKGLLFLSVCLITEIIKIFIISIIKHFRGKVKRK